jgi:hypothetical protein
LEFGLAFMKQGRKGSLEKENGLDKSVLGTDEAERWLGL